MVWYSELARRILPGPSSAPAGDKPPHYISQSPPLWIPAFAGMTLPEIRGIPRHYRNHETSSRIGVRDMPSYQWRIRMPKGRLS